MKIYRDKQVKGEQRGETRSDREIGKRSGGARTLPRDTRLDILAGDLFFFSRGTKSRTKGRDERGVKATSELYANCHYIISPSEMCIFVRRRVCSHRRLRNQSTMGTPLLGKNANLVRKHAECSRIYLDKLKRCKFINYFQTIIQQKINQQKLLFSCLMLNITVIK